MRESLENANSKIENYIEQIKTYSDNIISRNTNVLDSIMRDIKSEIIDNDSIDDSLLEHYFLSLTNALYFINSQVENMGFYDDISKLNYKIAYNEAFIQNKSKDIGNSKKQTTTDNQIAAENKSIEEQIMNIIYSRSYKIIKTKIDSGYEMVRTLSKIISSRQQEKQLSMMNKGGYNEFTR